MSRPGPRALAALALLATAVLLAACSAPSSRSPVSTTGSSPLPGVTSSAVTVGYTVVGGGTSVANSLGVTDVDQGDVVLQTRMVQAFVDYVNANGGAGGRRVVAVVKPYDAATSSPDQARLLCTSFTSDAKVFAAVLDGQVEDGVLPCYRDANTLMVDETPIPHDQTQFEEYSPYLWSPTHPEYGAFVATQLRVMRDQSFFDGATAVQVIAADDEVARRAVTAVVEPFLSSAGIARTQVNYVDTTNAATLSTTASAALAEGTAGGYDRVVVVGGSGVVAASLADQAALRYLSSWSISTFDGPGLLEGNPDAVVGERLLGMVGLGYAPAYDLESDDTAFPDPDRPSEGLCRGILDAAGLIPGDGLRVNYRVAFQLCDATLFLKAALDQAPSGGSVTGLQFQQAVGRIGTAYASSLTIGSAFVPGQYAATNAGRVLAYDASCACFTYKGDHVPITTR